MANDMGAAQDNVVDAVRLAPMRRRHLRAVVQVEEEAYPRPWTSTLFLSELAQRASRRYMVATIGPLVVGFYGFMIVGDEGHITTVTVEPGVAPAPHRDADVARPGPSGTLPMGIRHLTLEVRVGNDGAQSLYRRFGFAPVGVRRNYYAETGEDAVILWARDIHEDAYTARLAGIESALHAPPRCHDRVRTGARHRDVV